MSTLKVNALNNGGSAIDLPNSFKLGGNPIEQGYTSSATEPTSPNIGDLWWDSANEALYQYLNGEFKEISLVVPLIPFTGDRAVFANGFSYTGSADYKKIEYMAIATDSNATSFGNLTIGKRGMSAAGASNASRVVWSPGQNESNVTNNVYDYITTSTLGNATDFGDSTANNTYGSGGTTNGTYGLFGLGDTAVEYITIATTGNAATFGNLSTSRYEYHAAGNNSRTLFVGGAISGTRQSTIDYFTPDTAGNATDFGDLYFNAYHTSPVATYEKVFTMGGYAPSASNFVQQMTIATTGNATDYGDLNQARAAANTATDMTTAVIHGGANTSNISQPNIQKFTLATGANSNSTSGVVADFAGFGGGASGSSS